MTQSGWSEGGALAGHVTPSHNGAVIVGLVLKLATDLIHLLL